jgi:hypothetical protein
MTSPKVKAQRDEKTGRFAKGNASRVTHGLTRYLHDGRLPSIPGRRGIMRHLAGLKRSLEAEVPGSEDPRKQILIAQVVRAEGFQLLAEAFVKRVGLLHPMRLRLGVLAFQPIIEQLVSFQNSQRAALSALGMDKRDAEGALAPYEIVEREKKS